MASEEAVFELIDRLLCAVNDPDFPTKLAREEAERTDPWRWYCRICGAEGADSDRTVSVQQAHAHLDGCSCALRPTLGQAQAGRLLHVWRY